MILGLLIEAKHSYGVLFSSDPTNFEALSFTNDPPVDLARNLYAILKTNHVSKIYYHLVKGRKEKKRYFQGMINAIFAIFDIPSEEVVIDCDLPFPNELDSRGLNRFQKGVVASIYPLLTK